ncbi:MAG: DUF6090 family protein [Candidatus Marinimicrobia bacterium]|nr:hypothetical protein [Flavobacteriaceae bacterium]MBT5246381.1 hypothetical protein [Flavobacteriaceae bacterium]MBT7423248.1 hypothetical protein [Candidatus Neomarinimicrobiota bacterium]MDG2366651.1 DUF6090 family protein [Candidatus Neomarinimicrobiota bacterium]
MKNILARGGIEFLAVLLGITLSLWVDENSKNKDIHLALQKDLINIRADLNKDLNEIERIDSLKTKGLEQLEIYLDIINNKRQIEDADSTLLFNNYGNISYTFFPMGSSYLVSLNSGRINYIEDLELIIALSKYYQNSYERIKTNNFMFDEFLNKNFFRFRSILEGQKTVKDKINILRSGRFSEYILEAEDRISSYQSYVLVDMKNSANNLLNILEINLEK